MRYIKSSVDNIGKCWFTGQDADDIASVARDTRFFNVNDFELGKDAYYGSISDCDSYLQELLDFGAQIKDNYVYIPKGLKFSIGQPNFGGYDICRNGVTIGFTFFSEAEGGEPLAVSFTDLGMKCYQTALELDYHVSEVIKDISKYLDFFNIS